MDCTPGHNGSTAHRANLQRLFWLRIIAAAAETAAVAAAVLGLGLPLPVAPLGTIIGLLLTANAVTRVRLARETAPVTAGELFAQLLVDVAALTGLLYLSGGAHNPFVFLLLLPLTIAATVLPARHTWVMAALTIAAYTALLFFNRPLPFGDAGAAREYLVHVWGMWIGFVLLALLVAHFIVRMGETLRERDRLLAEEREKALRDERLVALGTLAAGTAHELATPLGTLTVLSRDMAEDYAEADPDLTDRLALLDEQVRRCKEALGTLSASAGEVRAESGARHTLDRFLEAVVAEWRATRPEGTVECHWDGPRPTPLLVGERVLAQALINILNNAADASPQAVSVHGGWDHRALSLDVCDRGPGLDSRAVAIAGREPFTTKEPGQGLGLGLFLAHAVIGRLGGEVNLYNRQGGGTCTRVWLPLDRLGEEERP